MDILKIEDDGSAVGNQDKKSYLILSMPDAPNYLAFKAEALKPQYTGDPAAENSLVVRHKSKYYIDYPAKLTQDEVAIVDDGAQQLPDGPLTGGGSVTDGIVSGIFTYKDFIRKQ